MCLAIPLKKQNKRNGCHGNQKKQNKQNNNNNNNKKETAWEVGRCAARNAKIRYNPVEPGKTR